MKDVDIYVKQMRNRLWAFQQGFKPKTKYFTTHTQKPTKPSGCLDLENYLTATQIELANLCDYQYSRVQMAHTRVKRAIIDTLPYIVIFPLLFWESEICCLDY